MPIHLPPISRRRFLISSIAASTGFCANGLFAAESKVDEHCWALLSDIHIAADRNKLGRDINMADNLKTVTDEIIALKKRPSNVLISGDCAFNSGETGDYATLTELLQPIRKAQMPVHLALGNHDNRERFWDALTETKAAARPLQDKQVAILKAPRANWFVLDSLEKTLLTPGLLGEDQLKWLADSLDANREKPALVMIHHNPDPGRNQRRSSGYGKTV